MDSPQPSKNNDDDDDGSSPATSLGNSNSNDSFMESPQVQFQESPVFGYLRTLSPIIIKGSRVGPDFQMLNSPPPLFKSPRISHRETQFVGRPQGTQSVGGVISQSENGGNCLGEVPADSEQSNSQQLLREGPITDTQKAFDSRNDANTENNSSSPSIEQYFVDPGFIDQMYSADQDMEQYTDAAEPSPSDRTQSKKNILKFDRKYGIGDKAEDSLPLSDDSNKVHQEKPAYGEEPEKMEGEKDDVDWAFRDPTNLESNLAADVFQKQYSHDPVPQDVKGYKDYSEMPEMVSSPHLTSENILQNDSQAPKYHGNRRRCLQFGEPASKALVSNNPHVKDNTTSSELKMDNGNFPMTDPKLSHVKQEATSSKMKMVKLSEPITSSYPQGASGNFSVAGPKPSGIGLHLSDGSQGMKPSSSIRLQRMENVKRSTLPSNPDRQSLVDTRNESREIDALVPIDYSVSESLGMTEPSPLYSASTHDKRKLSPIDAGNSEKLNQPRSSESKKKKKASAKADGNSCKTCTCKKSQCLKLYCECFAGGLFCTSTCICLGCYNRPEFVDAVCETKQQIESRDPMAFAPKIINPNADNKETTPSSARHKRGCNCKRSKCQKRYCECYQANVGCSILCGCAGCENVYGKNEDCVALGQPALSKERVNSVVVKGSDSSFVNKHEILARDMTYDHSTITPSLQSSDHQSMKAAKSTVISGHYLPSPAHVNMFLPHANYAESSEDLHRRQSFQKTNEMSRTASYGFQNNCNNVNMMDQSSPTIDSIALLLKVTAMSTVRNSSGFSPLSYGANEWTDVSQPHLSHGCIRQTPDSSLPWRSSPATPSTGVGEALYLQCQSDVRHFDIAENKTPDIMQEASTPMNSVKVNSPTRKRVFPLQSHPGRYGIESSSPGELRSGSKFIWKDVPSFPPLSPCVDSKGNGNEDLGNNESK